MDVNNVRFKRIKHKMKVNMTAQGSFNGNQFTNPAWCNFNFISNGAKIVLRICKTQTASFYFCCFGPIDHRREDFRVCVQIVSEYCHLIVLSLFFECFTVSSRSQNKCFVANWKLHFTLAVCFNNELCTRCVREQVTTKKTTKILVFHNSNDGGGRRLWLDLHQKQTTF